MLRGVRDPLTWARLLVASEKHIVLVAPSGLGKSTELRQQTRRLRDEGRHAVCISARELVAESRLEDALEPSELAALETWQSTKDHAVVCVDGVDELVLVGREFNALVRRLARLLGDHRKTCQLVLSARGGWSATHALAISTSLLEEKPDRFREITFEALDGEAVRRLAAAAGCQRVDGFMDSYRKREIEMTVEVRPMDIPVLVQRWNRDHALGSWSDILDGYMNTALSARGGTRDTGRALTLEDARRGGERVGIATVLMKTPFATVPSLAPVANTIGLRDLFADWAWQPISEFVETALFLQKGSSAVQLQQGALPHFLAARWLVERWRRGKNEEWLRDQLMVTAYADEQHAIPNSRRATVGWVASFVPRFRKYLTAYPEVVLYEGDPDNLHDNEIVKWLAALARRTSADSVHLWPSRGTLVKLARPSIEHDVVALLEGAETDSERVLLLDWAAAGRYKLALPTAVGLALDLSQKAVVRHAAIRVVAACDHMPSRQALQPIAGDPNDDIRADLLPVLVPHVLSGDALVDFIMNAGGDSFSYLLTAVVPGIPIAELEQLLTQLLPSVAAATITADSNRHFDVVLPLVVERLRRPGPYPDSVQGVLLAVEASSQIAARIIPSSLDRELQQLLEHNQALRRRMWLGRLEADSNSATYHARFGHEHSDDVAWLVEQGEARPELRSAAFAAAARLFSSLSKETREHIVDALQPGQPARVFLHKQVLLLNELEARRRLHEEKQREQAVQDRAQTITALEEHRAAIVQAESVNLLIRGWRLIQRSGAHRTLSTDKLRDAVGPDLLEDFLRGFKALWRKQAVDLPDPDSNEVFIRNLVALGGIGLEVADDLDFGALTPDLAERAARYALYELNGLPEWFSDLIGAHRTVVLSVLHDAVEREWSSGSSALSILRYAPYSETAVALALRTVAIEFLIGVAPSNPQALHSAVDAALLSSDRLEDVLAAARDAVHGLDATDPRLIEWLRAWTHLAPDEAAEWFNTRIETTGDECRALLVKVAALLERDFDQIGVDVAATRLMSPEALERWVSLLVTHLRPEEDVRPDGFLNAQHHAQDFRQRCLAQLSNDTSPLARDVLERLANRQPLKSYPDWADRLLAGQYERAVEYAATPWTEWDILAVERGDERRPRSLEVLFDMVRRHLRDVARVLIDDEFSYRDLIPSTTKERELQLWIASTLRQRARGLYSVLRENVVDDDKEVDITASVAGVGQIPIEIKPATSYSARQLEVTIQDQLVGRYMTQHDRTMGILLLVAHKRKQWVLGGKRRRFPALLAHLRREAQTLGAVRNKVIAVEGIDIESSRPKSKKAVQK